jgi:RHS repeat-associated protein
LVSLAGPSLTASFASDGLGRRAQKTVNSVLTQFQYDGLDAVKESSGGSDVAYLRTLSIDEALVRIDAVDTAYYLGEALGSNVALTTAGGTTATIYTYAPFGETAAGGTPNGNAFRFTGREDDATGLYYYRARYYDPVRSRFVSEDPIGFVGGINLYVYVHNNPLVVRDPLGLAGFPPSWNSDVGHSPSDAVGALTTTADLGLALVAGALGMLPGGGSKAIAVGVGAIADVAGMSVSLASPVIGPMGDYLSIGIGTVGLSAAAIAGSAPSMVLGTIGLSVTVGTAINRDLLDNRGLFPKGNPMERGFCSFYRCDSETGTACRSR